MSPREQDWHEIVVGDLIAFASPVPLQPTTAVGTDTAFSEWQGEGITVRVDYGLFVDRDSAERTRASLERRVARTWIAEPG